MTNDAHGMAKASSEKRERENFAAVMLPYAICAVTKLKLCNACTTSFSCTYDMG